MSEHVHEPASAVCGHGVMVEHCACGFVRYDWGERGARFNPNNQRYSQWNPPGKDVDQADLLTVLGRVAPGVAAAPYRITPASECRFCQLYECGDCGTEFYQCSACYKCCPCVMCDAGKGYKDLFVCSACGCRVWHTHCAPYVCICVEDCNCPRCCHDSWDGRHKIAAELATLELMGIELEIGASLAALRALRASWQEQHVMSVPSKEADEVRRLRKLERAQYERIAELVDYKAHLEGLPHHRWYVDPPVPWPTDNAALDYAQKYIRGMTDQRRGAR